MDSTIPKEQVQVLFSDCTAVTLPRSSMKSSSQTPPWLESTAAKSSVESTYSTVQYWSSSPATVAILAQALVVMRCPLPPLCRHQPSSAEAAQERWLARREASSRRPAQGLSNILMEGG
uniref:Uncharacterized protein n=1 Tax=Oxyrrhis marina TaxID=2969 RepID=A0A7S3UJG6_OXYMA